MRRNPIFAGVRADSLTFESVFYDADSINVWQRSARLPGACSCRRWYDIFCGFTASLAAEERADIFGRKAERAYCPKAQVGRSSA
jgi:hypothetical protein